MRCFTLSLFSAGAVHTGSYSPAGPGMRCFAPSLSTTGVDFAGSQSPAGPAVRCFILSLFLAGGRVSVVAMQGCVGCQLQPGVLGRGISTLLLWARFWGAASPKGAAVNNLEAKSSLHCSLAAILFAAAPLPGRPFCWPTASPVCRFVFGLHSSGRPPRGAPGQRYPRLNLLASGQGPSSPRLRIAEAAGSQMMQMQPGASKVLPQRTECDARRVARVLLPRVRGNEGVHEGRALARPEHAPLRVLSTRPCAS